MKFLILLSAIVTSSLFAQVNRGDIHCYESAYQNGGGTLAYVLHVSDGDDHQSKMNDRHIDLDYPRRPHIDGHLYLNSNGCLEGKNNGQIVWTACRGTGQTINRLVPIEVDDTTYQMERTVYCDREILRWVD